MRSHVIRGDVFGRCHDSRPCRYASARMAPKCQRFFRPSNKSNSRFICFFTAAEETVSACGPVHPPYAKPPLVSSCCPPGPCITPSREMNSSTLIFFISEFLRVLFVFVVVAKKEVFHRSSPQSGLNEPAPERCASSFISSAGRVFRGRSGQVVTSFRWVLSPEPGRKEARAPRRPHRRRWQPSSPMRVPHPYWPLPVSKIRLCAPWSRCTTRR